MRTSKQKIVFVSTTGKFNFLNPGNTDRRYWPLGSKPKNPSTATKDDLKKLVTPKRGAK